jgi:Na+-driven multidrug efflux pump
VGNLFTLLLGSASGIEAKISMINNLIANAVNVSCSTMIGQNVGAERYERVHKILKTAYTITLSVSCLARFSAWAGLVICTAMQWQDLHRL